MKEEKTLIPKSQIKLDRVYSLLEVGRNKWIKGMQYYALYDRIIDGRIPRGYYSELKGTKVMKSGKVRIIYRMTGRQVIALDKLKSI